MSKKCSKCGEVKELEDYGVNRRSSDGKNYACKACLAAKRMENYRRDPEKSKATSQRWKKANKKRCSDTGRAWTEKNHDRHLETSAKWKVDNKERSRLIDKASGRRKTLRNALKSKKHTYIVTDGEHIKVGTFTKGQLEARLNSLQTGNPRKLKVLATSSSNIEKLCHYEFEHLNVLNEWFKLDLEIITFFTENAE